MLMMLKLCYL